MNLSELIQTAKGDRSYMDLQKAANGTPLASRWHQLATNTLRNFPDPPTITGMARALGVTEWQVIRSSAESLGFATPSEGSPLQTLMPPGTERLAEDQVAACLGVIRSMIRHSS